MLIYVIIVHKKFYKMKVKKNKYGAIPTIVNNIRFDSKLEASFYIPLLKLAKTHDIALTLQKKLEIYSIQDKKYYYKADFYLEDSLGNKFFIDAKGYKIQESMTKIKIASNTHKINYYVGDKVSEAIYKLKKEFAI